MRAIVVGDIKRRDSRERIPLLLLCNTDWLRLGGRALVDSCAHDSNHIMEQQD